MERATPLLRSYIGGGWRTAEDEGAPLRDAVTGEEVARISSTGIDIAAALDYGRRVGGPALRELTFHQRAALLEALRLLSARAPRGAVRAVGADRRHPGRLEVRRRRRHRRAVRLRQQGQARTAQRHGLVEGDVEPLGKGGTFVGQHICTPLRGVAVQINAFNFPVWGPLEKFAPAFLAGVPSLIKPASQTAYLTARLVELIVESGAAARGRAPADLRRRRRPARPPRPSRTWSSFTGSAATGRSGCARTRRSSRNAVRFNAEADSLNCSILGPDAAPGTPEFDLYVKQLVTEMTVKAGQKCTAIRRAFVPAAHASTTSSRR